MNLTDVFLNLVDMSLAASWVVLAVLVLRLVLTKAPKWIRCLLWVLVAVRLVCPFTVESAFSLVSVDGAKETVEDMLDGYVGPSSTYWDHTEEYEAAVNAGIEPISGGEGHYYVVTGETPTTEIPIVADYIAPVWVSGMAVMLGYAWITCLRLKKRVAASVLVSEGLYLCDYIDTPFILGIIKPKVYLPSAMEPSAATHVLAHERAHLKRKDHWWKPLGFTLLTVYWFNPVMWLAYILLCRDIELACDEKVIREMGSVDKKAYSEALLACSVPRYMIAACPLAFGEVGVKERVKSVLHYKKPAFWIILIAVIALIVAAVCLLTDPVTESDREAVPYSYGYVNMSVDLPAGWEYEIDEWTETHENGLDLQTCGIRFRPEGEEGWVALRFRSNIFGAFTQEDMEDYIGLPVEWANYEVTQGTKEYSNLWRYIRYNFYRDGRTYIPGTYIAWNEGADGWVLKEEYYDVVMEILGNVRLAEGVLRSDQALEIARNAVELPEDYNYSMEHDYLTGIYTVYFSSKGGEPPQEVQVDNNGKVISLNSPENKEEDAQGLKDRVAQARDTLEELQSRESYHIRWQEYVNGSIRSTEVFKSGGDYLAKRVYSAPNGETTEGGHMLRDTMQYAFDWSGEFRDRNLTEWMLRTYTDSFKDWLNMAEWGLEEPEKFIDDGDSVSLTNSSGYVWTYTYTEDRGLTAFQYTDEDGNLLLNMEVLGTDADTIESMIDNQEGGPRAFSWEDDLAETVENWEVKTSGFLLANPQSISSSMDAFRLAMVEVQEQLGADFVIQNVCYDQGAKIWKVEFLLSENSGAFVIVYMDGRGVTQRIVSGK